jgi:hypothetical protein
MGQEGFSIKDLTIEELTSQAMQLLNVNLTDLYAVLGFQLLSYSQPARLAAIINYHTSLQEILEGQSVYKSLGSGSPVAELSHGLEAVDEELKQEGAQFVAAVREDLCKILSTPESLELAHRATAASMRVMLLMIAGALRMPPQTESLAVTLGAIICKSGLKDFCQGQPAKP